jgi:hypothetical protein
MLEHEALADRPPFSEAFHERLVRRLPAAATSRQPPLVAAAASPARRRTVVPLAVAVGLVGVAVLTMARPGRDGLPERSGVRVAAEDAAAGIGDGFAGRGQRLTDAAEELLGIDRLPMFDELEAEVRAGLTTLAVSLLEVPDWGPLAALAGAGLPDAGPPASNATSP